MFNSDSYLQFIGLHRNVLSYTEIEMVVKPTDKNGLIFYNGYSKDRTGDFISLALRNGYVEYRFDLGTGSAFIRSSVTFFSLVWMQTQDNILYFKLAIHPCLAPAILYDHMANRLSPQNLLYAGCPTPVIYTPLLYFFHCLLFPKCCVWRRASRHKKLAPTFPWIDNCLNGFSQNGSITMTKWGQSTQVGRPGWKCSWECLSQVEARELHVQHGRGRSWAIRADPGLHRMSGSKKACAYGHILFQIFGLSSRIHCQMISN